MSGANLLLRNVLPKIKNVRFAGHDAYGGAAVETNVIGNREIVGFGYNGEANYQDRTDFPFPAIRFKADTSDIKALREKEKGDWKSLTIAEKKALYRASYCQTFAEVEAPTGEWKSILGFTLVGASLALWAFLGLKTFVYNPTLPESFKEENRSLQLKRMLAFRMNPIEGISSQYDYDKKDWKK